MRPLLPRDTRWFHTSAFRLCTLGVALAVATGLTTSAVAASASAGHPASPGSSVLQATGSPAPPSQPSTASAPSGRLARNTTVTLPTGDQVRLDAASDGVQQANPIPAGTTHGTPQAASTFAQFTWRGDQYVVPDPAVPYLHSTLDPRLFDVSYLARAHLGSAPTGVPVHITYASATTNASLPGVHVTRRSGASATGNVTAAGAASFGQLLASQWQAARAGRSRTATGQLPGIARISLAPSPGAPALPAGLTQPAGLAQPAGQAQLAGQASPNAGAAPRYYTLTLDFTDLNGNAGTFLGMAQNVDNAGLYASFTTGSGSESLSVPAGTYSLEFSVETPQSSGTGFDTALVVKPQVSVNSDTTITMDARTAMPYQVTPGTAVNASVRSDLLGFVRTSVTGGRANTLSILSRLGLRLYSISPNPAPGVFATTLRATPTAPVTKGSFLFDANTVLSNTILGGSQGADPMYILDFPHQGSIPSSLTYTVPAANLTTVHEQTYNNPSGCGSQGQVQIYPHVFVAMGGGQWFGPGFSVQVPAGERTDYWYSSDPQLDLWQTLFGAPGGCADAGYGAVRTIAPGQQITETWNKAPLVPTGLAFPHEDWQSSVLPVTGDPRLTVCAACRQDDNGVVNVLAFGDSDPSHYGDTSATARATQALRFYRNGTLAITNAALLNPQLPPFGLELPLLHQAATYRLDWTWDRVGDSAATVDTNWTFQSGPDDPAASLPATGECAPDATRSCSYLPLLFLRYDLPLNTSSQASAGTPEPINFTVAGQQNAPAPSGVSATVSASFDGGQSWTSPQAAASLGNGQFTATISQPALADTDGFVALRVTATDGSGNSVTQTIIRAYGLTG